MSFGKEIKIIKRLNMEKNLFLFGFDVGKDFEELSYKIQQVVNYLHNGGYGYYRIEKGWLFVEKIFSLNTNRVTKLKFSPYTTKEGKEGFIRKVFNENNQFVFTIN